MAFDFQNNIDISTALSMGSPIRNIYIKHGLSSTRPFTGEYAARNMREYNMISWTNYYKQQVNKWKITYPLLLLDDEEIWLPGHQTQEIPVYIPDSKAEDAYALEIAYANLLDGLNRHFNLCDESNDPVLYELYNAASLYNQKWIDAWNDFQCDKETYYNICKVYQLLEGTYANIHNHIYISKDGNSLVSAIPVCRPYKDYDLAVYYIVHQIYLGLDKLNYTNDSAIFEKIV